MTERYYLDRTLICDSRSHAIYYSSGIDNEAMALVKAMNGLSDEADYYKKLYFTLKDTLFEAFKESNNKYPWLFKKEKIEELEKVVNETEEELKP